MNQPLVAYKFVGWLISVYRHFNSRSFGLPKRQNLDWLAGSSLFAPVLLFLAAQAV